MVTKSTTQIQIRIDTKTKKDVMHILESLGLDISTAVKMLCKQIQHTKSLPFEVRDVNGFTPQKAYIMQESLRESRASKKTFRSAKAVIKDLSK